MKRWTKKEEAILLECITLRQNNVREAFEEAADRLNKSVGACRYKYYHIKDKKPAVAPTVVDTPIEPVKPTKGSRWTEKEDEILAQQIELHPNCKQEAFEVCSKLTGRSVPSCAQRWYDYVSLQKKVFFATVSKTQSVTNRNKATRRVPAKKRNASWWEKVLKLLGF